MNRTAKQFFFASVFLVIVFALVYFIFLKPEKQSTCFNNIKDAGEEGVDCGGVCEKTCITELEPLKISDQKLIKIENFDYDYFVKIKNPNFDYGADEVVYDAKFFNNNNQVVIQKIGSLFLMPGQERFEVISPIRVKQQIASSSFEIKSVNWKKLKSFIPQSLFLVKQQEFVLLPPNEGFAKVKATILNNSNFDFDKVDIFVVLYDKDDNILAVNRTNIRTFLSKTNRFFEVKWAKPFLGQVKRIEIQANTNVFKNENFIDEFGTQEHFQKFY